MQIEKKSRKNTFFELAFRLNKIPQP